MRSKTIEARTATLARLPDCDPCKILVEKGLQTEPVAKATFDSPLEVFDPDYPRTIWGYSCLRHFNLYGLAPATRLQETIPGVND